MLLTRIAVADGGVALGVALSLPDAKEHLNVYHNEDDPLITAYVDAARAHLEGHDGTGGRLGRAITQHVLELTLPGFSAGAIQLPQPPLISVASVKYYDASNVQQTFGATNYHVVPHAITPRIELAYGKSWPATYPRPDAVVVRFTAGPAAVPGDLLHAIKLHVGHLYINREIAMEKALVTMPMGYDALIQPHRTHGWI